MEKRISKRERKYMINFLIYHWPIWHYNRDAKGYWADDKYIPVAIGATLESLVEMELVDKYNDGHYTTFRPTESARKYLCHNSGCQEGTFYEDGEPIGKCPVCDGTGIILSPGEHQ